MNLYALIISNKEILKIIYGIIITLICAIIVIKTNKLFRLSLHKGIRYFRNAFLFFGIGFLIRYFFGVIFYYNFLSLEFQPLINIFFEFFLIMGGFFLLYSLIWRKIETPETDYRSSLINGRILIFYMMAVITVLIDYFWKTFCYMFGSQIFLFAIATIISLVNYRKDRNKHKFLKFYFLAMLLSFIAWVLNFISAIFFEWDKALIINIYILNVIIFLLFLYGVFKVTRIR
jgi:hypothetical protein